MTERILTQHPQGKLGTNIEKTKYDVVRDAILRAIREQEEIPFSELPAAVEKNLTNFEGSIGWYTTTVKLDLEARGEIEQVPKQSPQVLRLK